MASRRGQKRGKRRRFKRPDKQAEIPIPPERRPKVPMENWSIETPFDSGEYLTRVAVPTRPEGESEQ